MTETLRDHVLKALNHLYDLVVLETSPLAALANTGSQRLDSRGRQLRLVLMDAIEALRPPEGTPSSDAAWRPYRILEGRHIARMSRQDVEADLSLSKSQYYREYDRALESLCSVLSDRWQLPADSEQLVVADALAAPVSALGEIGQLVEDEPLDILNLSTVLEDTVALLAPAAQARGVEVALDPVAAPSWIASRPGLVRQGLLTSLWALVQTLSEGRVRIAAYSDDRRVLVDYLVKGREVVGASCDLETATALVAAADGSVEPRPGIGPRGLRLVFAAARDRRQVLLVDNSRDLADLFERHLEGQQWVLTHAESVAEAIALCEQHAFDCILLDVLMPGEDGWHLMSWLRRSPEAASIPVVVCSVLDQPELAISLGATGYLRKPVTQEQLRLALQRWARDP